PGRSGRLTHPEGVNPPVRHRVHRWPLVRSTARTYRLREYPPIGPGLDFTVGAFFAAAVFVLDLLQQLAAVFDKPELGIGELAPATAHVGDRNRSRWRIGAAARRCAQSGLHF